ncbi:MAG TPA: YmdB family metallophosphoesterase, partial [Rhizomicrobium sp.]|nr:YmdB family metallophosphoesterase [Rhizomicrobium sp.]
MRLLFIGDIVGRAGRDVVAAELPRLKDLLRLDFIVVNGENLAGGFGVTRSVANEMFALGVDCITTGNHWLDQ